MRLAGPATSTRSECPPGSGYIPPPPIPSRRRARRACDSAARADRTDAPSCGRFALCRRLAHPMSTAPLGGRARKSFRDTMIRARCARVLVRTACPTRYRLTPRGAPPPRGSAGAPLVAPNMPLLEASRSHDRRLAPIGERRRGVWALHGIEAQLDQVGGRLGGVPRLADRVRVPPDDRRADLSRGPASPRCTSTKRKPPQSW